MNYNLESVNVPALVKDNGESYIFLYGDKNRAKTIRVLGRFARNEDLSFTWYDAALLTKKIRETNNKNNDGKIKNRLEDYLN